jgi:hypothetical protein
MTESHHVAPHSLPLVNCRIYYPDFALKSLKTLEKSPLLWYNCDSQNHNKKTEKEIFHMISISQDFYDEQCRSKTVSQFCKEFNLGGILKQANIRKARGIGVLAIFIHLISVAFSGKSLNQLLSNGELCGKKDAFYRFMNSTSANWLKFIRLLSSKLIIRLKILFFEDKGVLVLDDTIHKRSRSKNVELLTRVRDHNDGRYYRGFRCLTLCFQIMNAIVPVDFRILSSFKEKTRINGIREELDKRSNGYKIRQYAISNTFEMGFHGIGMLKAKKGGLYRYKGKYYNLESLYALVKPFIHRDQGYAAIGAELRSGIPISIIFVRNKENKRGWLAIGTTDLSLPPSQVITLYSRRWSIEVFFKTVKSCLGFAKECQSRSFDAIVCSVAVVFTRHMILTWLNLGLPVPETDGQLFIRLFDEMQECTFPKALEIVFHEIVANFVDIDETINMSLREFFAVVPSYFVRLGGGALCES